MDNAKPKYIFSSPAVLNKSGITGASTDGRNKFQDFPPNRYEVPSTDRLSHGKLSWKSPEDNNPLHETGSGVYLDASSAADTKSKTSSCSSSSEQCTPRKTFEYTKKRQIIESKWGGYALDPLLWEDQKAPVVKLRTPDEISLDDSEVSGVLSDRLIAAGSSFLTKSPENGLYVLGKFVMRRMSLTNIDLLARHRHLQYVDLAYNHLSNLMALGDIPYLMYLNASHNRIKHVLKFAPPWCLTYVNLSHNCICEICDLSPFWSIVRLDLSHNTIETITGLRNLKFLQYLNLSYNLIECIENLDHLNIQELNLEGNCISSFRPSASGNSLNVLPNLHTIMLGYNRLSTLDFIKEAYSLRFVDLKFNKISDLLEVANLRSLVYEIDLRGNPCTKWPNYRDAILFSMPSAVFVDGAEVSVPEKVSASTLFASPLDMVAARTLTKLTLLEQLNVPRIGQHVSPYDQSSPPLIILTGPSAVKKSEIAMNVAETLPKRIKYCPWHTTKQKGDAKEEHDIYIFVQREEFNQMTRRGDFLAIQELLGSSYGFHVDQIVSLMNERKIGITQTDLHATMQMRNRYPNVKSVLVLTKDEDVHRNWANEKFDVYTWCKDSVEDLLGLKVGKSMDEASSESSASKLNFITEIVEEVMSRLELPTYSMFVRPQGTGATATNIILQSETLLPKMLKTRSEVELEEKRHITFVGEYHDESFPKVHHLLIEQKQRLKDLKVILDERSNIIVEDAEAKRKRKRAKILYRRSGPDVRSEDLRYLEELGESMSSEDSLDAIHQPSLEAVHPENLKQMYTELVLRTRKLYLNHHINKPGFFCLVLLTDDYVKAFNSLISMIHELYHNQSIQKPIYVPEINYFLEVSVPVHVESVANEIRGNLLVPRLQHKTLTRTHGVTSWKDLMPSQINKHATEFVSCLQDELRRESYSAS